RRRLIMGSGGASYTGRGFPRAPCVGPGLPVCVLPPAFLLSGSMDPPSRPRDQALQGRRAEGRVVALTGASSFLGRNLVGLLEEDPRTERIIAVDVKAPDTSGAKTRMYPVDLTAPGSE